MPWMQRVAFALLAFALAGAGLIAWQPEGHANLSDEPPAYFLAISSGPGLKLGDSAATRSQRAELSCDRVFSLGPVEIGTRCVSHGWEVTITD